MENQAKEYLLNQTAMENEGFCDAGSDLRYIATAASMIVNFVESRSHRWEDHLQVCERCRIAWWKLHRHGW